MLAIFKIQIKSASNDGTEGNAKFPTYNSQTQEIKLMPIKFKCISKIAAEMITKGITEGIATGRLTTEPYQTESGKNRNRTVFVIEKFNALDFQSQPQVQPSPLAAELEAAKTELAALKSQLAASASKPPSKAKTTTKSKTKKAEVVAVTAPQHEVQEVDENDIPF
jgi:single-stranded DNA-binding protein